MAELPLASQIRNTAGKPVDAATRIEGSWADVYTKISGAYVGLQVYSEADKKRYEVDSVDDKKKILTYHELTYVSKSEKGQNGGVAPLGDNGIISTNYLPSYIESVAAYANLTAIKALGTFSKNIIYIAEDTKQSYRYVPEMEAATAADKLVPVYKSISLGDQAGEAFPGNRGKTIEDNYVAKIPAASLIGDQQYVLKNNTWQKLVVPATVVIVDDLNQTTTGKALDARQGHLLDSRVGKLGDVKFTPKKDMAEALNTLYEMITKVQSSIEKKDVVYITAKTDVESETIKAAVAKAGFVLTINGNEEAHYACVDGKRTISVPSPNKYSIKFDHIDGIEDIPEKQYTAEGYSRQLEFDFKKPSLEANEEVSVCVYNNDIDGIVWKGVDVWVKIGNEAETKYTTDDNGEIPRFFVSKGTSYQVRVRETEQRVNEDDEELNYKIQGKYKYELTAGGLFRSLSFSYASADFGVFVVDNTNKEIMYREWMNLGETAKANAVAVKFVTPELKQYGGVFLIRLWNFAGGSNVDTSKASMFFDGAAYTIPNIGTGNLTTLKTDYPKYYYNGYESTKEIVRSYSSATKVVEGNSSYVCEESLKKVFLNGTGDNAKSYTAFVPSYGQIEIVKGYKSILQSILTESGNADYSANINGTFWTSSQVDNLNMYMFTGGGLSKHNNSQTLHCIFFYCE